MAGFHTFEEIESWKKARSLTQDIYRITQGADFARDFALRDQIRRSAISITSNIAEGFEQRSRPKEFLRFLRYAKGSVGEVRSQLYVAMDEGYIDKETFGRLYADATDTINLIGGLMHYLRTKNGA